MLHAGLRQNARRPCGAGGQTVPHKTAAQVGDALGKGRHGDVGKRKSAAQQPALPLGGGLCMQRGVNARRNGAGRQQARRQFGMVYGRMGAINKLAPPLGQRMARNQNIELGTRHRREHRLVQQLEARIAHGGVRDIIMKLQPAAHVQAAKRVDRAQGRFTEDLVQVFTNRR